MTRRGICTLCLNDEYFGNFFVGGGGGSEPFGIGERGEREAHPTGLYADSAIFRTKGSAKQCGNGV